LYQLKPVVDKSEQTDVKGQFANNKMQQAGPFKTQFKKNGQVKKMLATKIFLKSKLKHHSNTREIKFTK